MKPSETRNIKELIESYNAGAHPKYVFFWGHSAKKNAPVGKECLSQWYTAKFEVDSVSYPTAEHYMMAMKAKLFNDDESFGKIIGAANPSAAKAAGRGVKNFNETVWNDESFEIVVQANYHKFGQNTELKEYLLNTKNRVLVEASPQDKIWGIGLAQDDDGIDQPVKWKGKNKLGFALMEARERLLDTVK